MQLHVCIMNCDIKNIYKYILTHISYTHTISTDIDMQFIIASKMIKWGKDGRRGRSQLIKIRLTLHILLFLKKSLKSTHPGNTLMVLSYLWLFKNLFGLPGVLLHFSYQGDWINVFLFLELIHRHLNLCYKTRGKKSRNQHIRGFRLRGVNWG